MTSNGLNNRSSHAKLGFFGGVFTPSVLTILGIILFLRTGYIVGEVGLLQALIIIGMANVISVLTSLSLAGIATGMQVKSGGFYYLISRTLGVEFGGALGLVLFLSISTGIAFYAIGLGEVVADIASMPEIVTPRRVALAVILFLFGFAWAGADWATKLQYIVMVLVAVALLGIIWGGVTGWEPTQLSRNWSGPIESGAFWIMFALFFPAITGFTQGLNMSGDLKDPGRAIPIGTLLAVGISIVIYVGVAVLTAANMPADRLRDDYFILSDISPIGWLVAAGAIAATASSAMASFLGAPRVLQALAQDRVFPLLNPFAQGAGRDNNPRRAVLLSLSIALAAVAIGNLNFLAPVITMFFLVSYALLNYATFYVANAASPSFRPSFKCFNKYLSLAGALACLSAMIAIDIVAALVAVALMTAIYEYLRRTAEQSLWSDSRRAYGFQRIRQTLFEIETLATSPRDWRPQIIALSRDAENRRELLCFASWIEGASGLTSVLSIIDHGQGDTRDRDEAEAELAATIEDEGVEAFPLVIEAPDFRTGLEIGLQAYGIGPIEANTILLNWLEDSPFWKKERSKRIYGRNMKSAISAGFNIVILSASEGAVAAIKNAETAPSRIDIWWTGGHTSRLMLMLAYLMTRTDRWRHATIRILAQGKSRNPERTRQEINAMLDDVRILAEVEIIDDITDETVTETSGASDLVLFPIAIVDRSPVACLDLDLDTILRNLPAVALCIAGADVELEADPDNADGGDKDRESGSAAGKDGADAQGEGD